MKKIILATACAVASGTIFANSPDSTEQRINALELELQRLKTELAEQKSVLLRRLGLLGLTMSRSMVLPVWMQP